MASLLFVLLLANRLRQKQWQRLQVFEGGPIRSLDLKVERNIDNILFNTKKRNTNKRSKGGGKQRSTTTTTTTTSVNVQPLRDHLLRPTLWIGSHLSR